MALADPPQKSEGWRLPLLFRDIDGGALARTPYIFALPLPISLSHFLTFILQRYTLQLRHYSLLIINLLLFLSL